MPSPRAFVLAGLVLGCRSPEVGTDRASSDEGEVFDTSWTPAPWTVDSGDTAVPSDSGDPVDTGRTVGPCDAPPEPGRGMGFQDLLLRLSDQHCLVEEDIVAVEAWMAIFEAQGLKCDQVWRTFSADGLRAWSVPELVLQNASVPDIFIQADGTHVLVYNDVRPGLLVDVIRTDPERLWRQGLVGLGGMGMSVDFGYGFGQIEGLDLHLSTLQQVVDPDLARLPDGTWRVTWFGIEPDQLEDGTWEPVSATLPHRFWRQTGPDPLDYPNAQVAVESDWEDVGGVDPTILDVGDGSEILFAGAPEVGMPAWISEDGYTWDPDDPPDFVVDIDVTTPDATADPDGGYRIYFRDDASGLYHLTFSEDGRTWSERLPAGTPVIGGGVSVAVDPDGVWWMYFNQRDPECDVAEADGGSDGDPLALIPPEAGQGP